MWYTVFKYYDEESELSISSEDYVDAVNIATKYNSERVESISLLKDGAFYDILK